MKTLGLLGGMSWESTAHYYQLINRDVAARLGGLHSAQLLLYSVNFHDMQLMQREGRWQEAGEVLARAAVRLQVAGADGLVLCTNTMHKVASQIEAAVDIPLLHIADATATALLDDGRQVVGLLGTRFTMEESFYRERLESRGLKVCVPQKSQRDQVNEVIFAELCRGQFLPASRAALREIIIDLVSAGAEGIVFGCTEIGLLLDATDASVPVYDTTALHARRAVDFALEKT